ncbi:MAG: protease inhibitor I42 family protein [Clostridium sp.]|nr:protease inhibitor I42 family protein [Clostridium sp.]
MIKNKLIAILGVFFILFATGCDSSFLHKNKISNNVDAIDKFLDNEKFHFSKDINKKIIYVVFSKSNENTINEYSITNNYVLNITGKPNEELVISLPANNTVAYTWNIKSNINNSILLLQKKSKMKPINIPSNKIGLDYTRENFYFKLIKEGNQTIKLKYEHINSPRAENFTITINLSIKK